MKFSLQIVICLCISFLIEQSKTNAAVSDRSITVHVNGAGIINVGRDTISSDNLAMYIRERLFKSYTGTGKMYDAVKLVMDGNPQDRILEVIKKEITNGLTKTLNELCLEKYKKLYADIGHKHQSKLKKNFPVLFQSGYN